MWCNECCEKSYVRRLLVVVAGKKFLIYWPEILLLDQHSCKTLAINCKRVVLKPGRAYQGGWMLCIVYLIQAVSIASLILLGKICWWCLLLFKRGGKVKNGFIVLFYSYIRKQEFTRRHGFKARRVKLDLIKWTNLLYIHWAKSLECFEHNIDPC